MEIDQLRTFLAVLEHGSFSRAGEALHIGQSTVSFHIKALESVVKSRILDRRGGQVRPTATGRTLIRFATRIVALRDEALRRLRDEESGDAGRVTIAASTVPAECLLPAILVEFQQTHPRVSVLIDVSDSRRAAGALLEQECDIALRGARIRDRRVVCSPFADDEIVLVGPTRGRWASFDPRTAAELRRAPIIAREEGSGTRKAVGGILARLDSSDAGASARIQIASNEAARRCVVEGLGLTFISRRLEPFGMRGFAPITEDDYREERLALRECEALRRGPAHPPVSLPPRTRVAMIDCRSSV